MKAVVQRVLNASVSVAGGGRTVVTGTVPAGLLVYLGVARGDRREDAAYLAEKVTGLRIFDDGEGKMNLSVKDTGGSVLAVSQFTLLADARKGRRPSYSGAAQPEEARPLYEYFIEQIRLRGLPCAGGVFQAHMRVSYTNDGPVTILLDSRLRSRNPET
ncbi:MAG: D-tyrosyl-tRNA(Tyr) deacylase [Treponema sp.]|nr:D-tyrosyl-tRNA(Tyr) deacylase [Treponema sp.]